jgi:RecG-like helicase
MLMTQTLEKLQALRLEGMAQALEEQRHQNDIVPLSFEDRLALLVERQWLWRENRALATRLKNAQLKISASLEDLDYRATRGLKRAQIDQLRACPWVKEHRNCLITGPTGSGKTLPGLCGGRPGLPRRSSHALLLCAQIFPGAGNGPGRREPVAAAQKAGPGAAGHY